MCDQRPPDPRDALGEAEAALWGLRRLLNELPYDADVSVRDVAPLVTLLHEWIEPAAKLLQDYVPRSWTPPTP